MENEIWIVFEFRGCRGNLKNETHSSPKCANLGADQAWKAELLFGEAGVARDDMPRTLLSQPHVWVGRWRDRWGVALRAVGKVSDLPNDVVRERVEAFSAECKHVLSTSADALWVNFDETP